MIDQLGLPTLFVTHSAADTQWPELAKLLKEFNETTDNDPTLANNPMLADWFFHHRFQKYIKMFYVDILGEKTIGSGIN
jgi:hypothetical protein